MFVHLIVQKMPETKMTGLADSLSASELLERCQQSRPDNTHEPFCLELFRRAIVDKSEACWAAIYQQYQRLVYRWLLDFTRGNEQSAESTFEELMLDAFTAFWRAYTADKLQNADGLGSILAYLKSCAATAVLQARRKAKNSALHIAWDQQQEQRAPAMTQILAGFEQSVLNALSAEQVWAVVDACCADENERIIARLSFVADLKPRSILERHPERFSDVEEIYTTRRNLKNRLWRDERLRELWGGVNP